VNTPAEATSERENDESRGNGVTPRQGQKRTQGPGIDDTAVSRASAVYQEEFDRWEGLIDAVAHDYGLSREQRTSGILALRLRQKAAAKRAQQRVMEEEKAKAKAFRLYQKQIVAGCNL
jgi:hypothetical protein